MYIRPGTRMIQTRKNIINKSFTLYNTDLATKCEVNYRAARILRKILKNPKLKKERFPKDIQEFIRNLYELGYIIDSISTSADKKTFLAKKCKHKLPLTALNLELTNLCNLNCIHCYGSFNEKVDISYISFEWVKEQLPILNDLHTQSISLTGGEICCHPKFAEITSFFLENGFEVAIFTNGYNYNALKNLLVKCKNYKFRVKISCDGFEDSHNYIRGKRDSYSKVIMSLDELMKYSNVTTFISSVAMKSNIEQMDEFKRFITGNYPSAVHVVDLVFPSGNATSCSFSMFDLDYIYDIMPSLFKIQSEETENTASREYRCSGGISQCTITPSGWIKICNGATDIKFQLKHNVFEKGLIFSWKNPGENILVYRSELARTTKDCITCKYKDLCTKTDCRIMALAYLDDETRSNPLTCYSTKRSITR